MKCSILTMILICSLSMVYGQNLPFNFETDITTSDFVDFDGGTATVIDNPQSNASNASGKVAQIVRNGGANYAGSKIILDNNLDFSNLNVISMKVFTTAPAGTVIKIKLEGGGSAERDMLTTASGEWEVIAWDFTGTPPNFNELVFMFDFGNVGDGSENSTFLFDDVEQLFGGSQIDLPVDFESSNVNYTMTDFEGNASFLTTDPTDSNNTVVQAMKTNQASPSAGTTIGTPAGFATNIPLTLTDSKMTVRVWTPEAGTPIRLKVEDSNDPTRTCETETNTTLSGEWETLEFDFTNQAPGTELLSVGLSMGWTYNKASIFFNFGTNGASDGGTIYYFDDVKFGGLTSSVSNTIINDIKIFPNPSNAEWNIHSQNEKIHNVKIFDIQGKLIKSITVDHTDIRIDGTEMSPGLYHAKIYTDSGESVLRIFKN